MRKIILILVPAIGLLLPLVVQAQSTLYVSNLGVTSGGSKAVGSDSWLAALFRTGTNAGGYSLDSVQLLMDAASGSPNGFSVLLYSYNNNSSYPGSSLGGLSGLDPTAGGVFTYTANITLSPSTDYFIVLTATTPIANGYYNWSSANNLSYSSSDDWFLGAGYNSSSDGSSWVFTRPAPLQFAVYASEVPEPATYALAGLGLAALSFRRRGK